MKKCVAGEVGGGGGGGGGDRRGEGGRRGGGRRGERRLAHVLYRVFYQSFHNISCFLHNGSSFSLTILLSFLTQTHESSLLTSLHMCIKTVPFQYCLVLPMAGSGMNSERDL